MVNSTDNQERGQLVLRFDQAPSRPAPSHAIDRVKIRNFRLCKAVDLGLAPLTPLVGINNAGKSTILRAIAWALSPRKLETDAFNDPDLEVEVALRIVGLTDDLLAKIPDDKHRKAIEPCCVDGILWIRVLASAKDGKPDRQVWDVAATPGSDPPTAWKKYPTGLPEAVQCLLPDALHIDATKDLSEDLGKAKAGTTIKGLLDEVMGPVMERHKELTGAVETIRGILDPQSTDRSPFLEDFDRASTLALQDFFPGLTLRLNPASIELKEFFKAGDLMVHDDASKDLRRFDQVGAGAQRSIQMALVRRLADLQRPLATSSSRRLLLIDEPELFLHPQAARFLRDALEKLAQGTFQVVFSTHSPLMLGRRAAEATVIVGRNEGGCFTRTPLGVAVKQAVADHAAQARVLFELGSLADIYFSELVVICEGKTERALLPLLYAKERRGRHVAFVSLRGGDSTRGALCVLAAMQIAAGAIVDLDFGFSGTGSNLLSDKQGTLTRAREIFQRLAGTGAFEVGDNGFPKTKGVENPAVGWEAFARDTEGASLVGQVHDELLAQGIWMWRVGAVEDVLHIAGKGELVIEQQEQVLGAMSSADVRSKFPELAECFQWLNSLEGSSADSGFDESSHQVPAPYE
jgi:putative ATP-dependent endonuclease of OLD family